MTNVIDMTTVFENKQAYNTFKRVGEKVDKEIFKTELEHYNFMHHAEDDTLFEESEDE